jgi:uncharacterized membrane protein HdeD (DUF308 family)
MANQEGSMDQLLGRSGGWLFALGLAFIVLGAIAIVEPLVAGLALALLVGWLLVFGGVAHAIAAFSGGGASRVAWQAVLAFIYIVGGVYFIMNPVIGLGSLTLFLAAILVAEAVVELVAYFQTRTEGASTWGLVNGLVTLLLGIMIWSRWPSSSVWAIGTLVGVNLLMTGFSRLMAGSALRAAARR